MPHAGQYLTRGMSDTGGDQGRPIVGLLGSVLCTRGVVSLLPQLRQKLSPGRHSARQYGQWSSLLRQRGRTVAPDCEPKSSPQSRQTLSFLVAFGLYGRGRKRRGSSA